VINAGIIVMQPMTIPYWRGVSIGLRLYVVVIELNKIEVREPRMAETKKNIAMAVPLIYG
jgi:hypothetical protein